MTEEGIIRMAKEIFDVTTDDRGRETFSADSFGIQRMAALVAVIEREACAKVCDDFERAKWESVKNISQNGGRLAFAGPMECAVAIRARSNT